MMNSIGICEGECGRSGVVIVNKKYKLCSDCNRKRIDGQSPEKKQKEVQNFLSPARSSLKSSRPIGTSKRSQEARKEKIRLDEEFYEEIWNDKPHFCEECDIFLGDEFRDDNGKVINKFRYSHILGKGAYPMLRRNKRNINLLCLVHHNEWEHGVQEDMKIYKTNIVIIQELHEGLVREG